MIIAKRLKWLREQNRYAQKEVAAQIGLSLNGYQKIEYGDREPKIEGLVKLAKFYDVSVDFIVGLDDHTNSLKKKYQNVLNYKFNEDFLGKEHVAVLTRYSASEEEQNVQLKLLKGLSFKSGFGYEVELREYVNEIIFVPEFNPYKNEILKIIFPIKFKVTEELNDTYTLRLFTRHGHDIASLPDERYEDYELVKKEEELRNSIVKKFWDNGVEPEHNDYQTYIV